MNRGTSICVGQARVQGASKQNRQRAASTRASLASAANSGEPSRCPAKLDRSQADHSERIARSPARNMDRLPIR